MSTFRPSLSMLPLKLNVSLTISFALIHFQICLGGSVANGGNCSISNNHLDSATHKLLTDCNDKTFCTLQNTCEPRQCRTDQYPFGYDPGESLPPVCPQGQYCPDEGDACKPWLSFGQTCQLNRDDQCAPPTDGSTRVSSPDTNAQSPMTISGLRPMDYNGAICLHLTCMYANATLGTACITDSTVYVGSGPKGEQFSNIVLRDNCISPGLYCNGTSNVCVKTQELGQACQNDQECESYNCNAQNVCAVPPETPVKVPAWQYALTGVAVFLAMIATCMILVFVHKRHRKQRNAEIREYYREQLGYRRSIIALHSVAVKSRADSIYSRPKFGSPDSRVTSGSTLTVYGGCIDDCEVARRSTRSTKRHD